MPDQATKTLNANELWTATLGELQGQLTKATYDQWLRPTRVKELSNGVLTVTVPPLAKEWLEVRLCETISRTVTGIYGQPLEIRYVVNGNAEKQEPPNGAETEDRPEEISIGVGPDTRRWFMQIPNLLDDSDLDPFEYRLVSHYYRVGNCWQSIRTTADLCHMSKSEVSRARERLTKKVVAGKDCHGNPFALDEKWITTFRDAQYGTTVVRVANIWKENMAFYAKIKDSTDHTN